jgi:anaerobic magnesium-protoporphyrin IX monomethyl ester cyclase
MRILLTTLNAKYIHMNLAVRLLYGLNRHHEGLEWKEFTIRQNTEEIAEACKDFDVVAFSCYIWNITKTLEAAHLIKSKYPHIKILFGGPEVSYEWQEIIDHPAVDYIITGEGEIPFHEFLLFYPNVSQVRNLVYKENGQVHYQEQSIQYDVSNFAGLNPYVFEDAAELKNKISYIETSRGCPYKCEFCLASLDNKVRYLPMQDIRTNLLYLMQHGRVIKFLDRTFNMKRDFTLEVFQFILDHHRHGNVFQFEITADILHPDIIKFIQEKVPKGLFRFEIGIQTVNQKANLEVSRKQNFEKTKSIIFQVREKVDLHLDLIVGLPLDYFEDIRYSFNEVFRLFAPELQLGFLKFLKGTPVRDKSNQHAYVFQKEAPYEIIQSKYLSKEELRSIRLLEEALEIYWNKGRVIRTLKYISEHYSAFDFLMRLGNYFEANADFHRHDLSDVYRLIYEFCTKEYTSDKVLLELISIDYYMQHKIKPKSIFSAEVADYVKKQVISEMNLNHHQYRFAMISLSFQWKLFETERQVMAGSELLIIRFSGKDTPEIVTSLPKKLNDGLKVY